MTCEKVRRAAFWGVESGFRSDKGWPVASRSALDWIAVGRARTLVERRGRVWSLANGTMQFYFHPVWPWPICLTIAAILGGISYWTYRGPTPKRRLLLGLRFTAIFLAIVAVLRPSLVFTKKQKRTSVLAVMVDKSKSMMLRDMWDGQSRWQATKKLLIESDFDFGELSEEVQVRYFEFGRKLSDTIDMTKDPTGEQTALGDALQEVLRRTAGERVAGILVLSDGANTAGISPLTAAQQLRTQGVPIYAFGFGQEVAGEEVRDIAAKSILTNPTVFAKNKMAVRGEFSTVGFANQPITVRLLLDGVEASRGTLTTKQGQPRGIVDLSAIPRKPGDVKVTLEAATLDGEHLTDNNSVSTFVTALSGGVSVLYIEGKYRFWEPKFVRWALDKSGDIELNQLFLLDTSGRRNEMPADLFEPGRFDVYILGDIASNQFRAQDLSKLATLVTNGAGLMMIGGYDSFGPGGWGSTPIADVLPVEMRASDGQIGQPLKVTPTDSGTRHFILRLAGGAGANRTAWEALRPLDGGSSWTGLKPNALLLATSDDGIPVLAALETVGRGRSIAMAGDTTWRWRRGEAGIAAHARYWRQLILWLAKKDENSETVVHVTLDRRRLAMGQKAPFLITIEGPDGAPVTDAEVSAKVEDPEGNSLGVDLFQQAGAYRGTFWQTELAGDYTLRVNATQGDENLGERAVKFLVYDDDAELRQLAADLELLRGLANATDGEFHTAEELPPFVASLKERDLNQEVSRPVYENLWDRWQMFLLFTAVVTLEWVMRKRSGLA